MADEAVNVNVPTSPVVSGVNPTVASTTTEVNPGTPGGTQMTGAEGDVAKSPGLTPLGSDGEPTPIGTPTQKAVAEAIAATFRGETPVSHDVNVEIKRLADAGQIQSTPGPTPVEQDQSPAVNAMSVKPVKVHAQGVVEPPKVG